MGGLPILREDDINTSFFETKKYTLDSDCQFIYENGAIYNKDCTFFLKALKDSSVDTIFADPPYNIKKASWDNIGSIDEYVNWSMNWIKEASRILKDTGTLYICGFTEILADLKRPALDYFYKCKWLIWYYDNKANLTNDWGRSHESILCLRKSKDFTFNIDQIRIPYNKHTRKYPERKQNGKNSQYGSGTQANKIWQPNPNGTKPKDVINLPTTCNGMEEKTAHPTQKPEALLRKLILASTNENDIVVDPFSGSGTTAVVATELKRKFLVNDNCNEYNIIADSRLQNLKHKTIEEWIAFDKESEERRRSLK